MIKLAYGVAAVTTLTACVSSYPTVQAPDLAKPRISLLFEFPEGSTCQVSTSAGVLKNTNIPGKIDFSQRDRNAPASCTLPSGQTVRVTAHNFVPEENVVAGITVYPDGRAFITSSTSGGQLVQLQPTGTVTAK